MCFLYYLRARSRSVPSELPFEPATLDQNASTYILRFYAAATIAAAVASVPFCLEVILYDQQVQGDSMSTSNYEVVQRAPATTPPPGLNPGVPKEKFLEIKASSKMTESRTTEDFCDMTYFHTGALVIGLNAMT